MAADGSESTQQPFHGIVLNCDHGDPTMFEAYWNLQHETDPVITTHESYLSYFATTVASSSAGKSPRRHHLQPAAGTPWFVAAELDEAVRELHALAGNAVATRDRAVVVGNGSTQLFQAALHAFASAGSDAGEHTSSNRSCGLNSHGLGHGHVGGLRSMAVVAQSPFYSAYPQIIEYLQSKLFHWAGDARAYKPKDNHERCMEMVTSPNNPCGGLCEGEFAKDNGVQQVHDLAYYWPTYTPITMAMDHDVMLFTLSKCSGHAGLRIGWAIVKDPAVARKMAEFVAITTIGVSHDAQSRAAGIIQAIVRGYNDNTSSENYGVNTGYDDNNAISVVACSVVPKRLAERKKLFHWGNAVMRRRWERVRAALAGNRQFSVPEPSEPATCTFLGAAFSTYSAFIWLRCETEAADCQMILRRNGILARGGGCFGASPQYARLSLIDREPALDVLIQRLEQLSSTNQSIEAVTVTS